MKYEVHTGSLLVAEPFMQDSNFRRAVILVTDHAEDEGTVGFIINKPLIHSPVKSVIHNFCIKIKTIVL